MNPLPPWRRLLVRGVNWLGDAVMSEPALQRLREARPAARITLLTHAKLADLWRHHPAVDDVIAFAGSETPWAIARRLRAEQFDAGLALPNSPRSALELWLARIPRRVGVAWPWRNWLLTEVVPPRSETVKMRKRPPGEVRRLIASLLPREQTGVILAQVSPAHHLHHYLHLAAALGADPAPLAPRIFVTPAELAAARARFDLPAPRRWLGLNPGAEYGPAKRWPLTQFAAVAREIAGWPGWGVVIFGGPGDVSLAGELETAIRPAPGEVRNLAGRTSLRELCTALALCRVVVTNDSGPMHVAAAVGTRVMAIFGSTSPELTGPGLPGDPRHRLLKSRVPCAPCFRRECPIDLRCLHQLGADAVVREIQAMDAGLAS